MIEAGVGELQPQDVFPIDAAPDGLGRLAIGEVFGKLQDGSEREAGRGGCRLAAPREECGELGVVVDGAEPVSHLHIDVAVRERGTGHPLGVFRDRIVGFGV